MLVYDNIENIDSIYTNTNNKIIYIPRYRYEMVLYEKITNHTVIFTDKVSTFKNTMNDHIYSIKDINERIRSRNVDVTILLFELINIDLIEILTLLISLNIKYTIVLPCRYTYTISKEIIEYIFHNVDLYVYENRLSVDKILEKDMIPNIDLINSYWYNIVMEHI